MEKYPKEKSMVCARCGVEIEPFNNKNGTCGADFCMTKMTNPQIEDKRLATNIGNNSMTNPQTQIEEILKEIDESLEECFNLAIKEVLKFVQDKTINPKDRDINLSELGEKGLEVIRKNLLKVHSLGIQLGKEERTEEMKQFILKRSARIQKPVLSEILDSLTNKEEIQ